LPCIVAKTVIFGWRAGLPITGKALLGDWASLVSGAFSVPFAVDMSNARQMPFGDPNIYKDLRVSSMNL
jgi:hypothetical protein